MNGFGDRNTNHCMTPLSASTKCIISYIKKNAQGFFHLFTISFLKTEFWLMIDLKTFQMLLKELRIDIDNRIFFRYIFGSEAWSGNCSRRADDQ